MRQFKWSLDLEALPVKGRQQHEANWSFMTKSSGDVAFERALLVKFDFVELPPSQVQHLHNTWELLSFLSRQFFSFLESRIHYWTASSSRNLENFETNLTSMHEIFHRQDSLFGLEIDTASLLLPVNILAKETTTSLTCRRMSWNEINWSWVARRRAFLLGRCLLQMGSDVNWIFKITRGSSRLRSCQQPSSGSKLASVALFSAAEALASEPSTVTNSKGPLVLWSLLPPCRDSICWSSWSSIVILS